MNKTILIIFGLAFSAFTYGAALTPQMVMAHIDSKGTQSAREAYFSCWDSAKGEGYKLVKSGAVDWLRIAAILIKDADGCYIQGLQTSIALAQINNAVKVLEMVDSENKLGAAYICIPFLPDEVDPENLRTQLNTLDRIENALKKVKAPKLKERKEKCLTYVRSSQEYIKESLPHGNKE